MSDRNSHAAGTYLNACDSGAGHAAPSLNGDQPRPLRAVAATHLRRGRHLRAVPEPAPAIVQLDLFAAGCEDHGTPPGRSCALCLDQLELFGPGAGDPA